MQKPEITAAELTHARSRIREIPDYPSAGILFRDISPLLADGAALRTVTAALTANIAEEFDAIAGIEARGFLLGTPCAVQHGCGILPVRKAGKLPKPHSKISYELEYGVGEIEIQAELPRGSRILIIDDVLATGGTVAATAQLLREVGYEPVAVSVLYEIAGLGGREMLGDLPLYTVFDA